MKKNSHSKQFSESSGYSLVELLMALVVMGVAFTIIGQILSSVPRLATKQEVTAGLQQGVRTALEIMARDIRMAGFDPEQTGIFGIEVAQASNLRFTADRCDDVTAERGVLDSSCPNGRGKFEESVTYFFAPGTSELMRRANENTGGQYTDSLLEDIKSLSFDYRDRQNNLTTATSDVRAIIITLRAESPAGQAGMIEREYSMRVECRNMGF